MANVVIRRRRHRRPDFNPMAFGIAEKKDGRSPVAANLSGRDPATLETAAPGGRIVHLEREGDACTSGAFHRSPAIIRDTQISIPGKVKFHKPIGFKVNDKPQDVPIERDGSGPSPAVEDGVGSLYDI